MDKIRIDIDMEPASEDIKMLGQGLNQHAIEQIGSRGFEAVAVWAMNPADEKVGGIQAYINWNWLHVCLVWIDDRQRGNGLGEEMLKAIESIGRERGCANAHLDTFSFQARGFYEKYGYEVYGQLDDYPAGQTRYYMRKAL